MTKKELREKKAFDEKGISKNLVPMPTDGVSLGIERFMKKSKKNPDQLSFIDDLFRNNKTQSIGSSIYSVSSKNGETLFFNVSPFFCKDRDGCFSFEINGYKKFKAKTIPSDCDKIYSWISTQLAKFKFIPIKDKPKYIELDFKSIFEDFRILTKDKKKDFKNNFFVATYIINKCFSIADKNGEVNTGVKYIVGESELYKIAYLESEKKFVLEPSLAFWGLIHKVRYANTPKVWYLKSNPWRIYREALADCQIKKGTVSYNDKKLLQAMGLTTESKDPKKKTNQILNAVKELEALKSTDGVKFKYNLKKGVLDCELIGSTLNDCKRLNIGHSNYKKKLRDSKKEPNKQESTTI